jgi:hypothetical protein
MKGGAMKIRFVPLLGIAISFLLGSNMSQAAEEPSFEVLEQWDEMEIREYAPTIRAVTDLSSNGETTGGFRRLADYIFGGNSKGMSIAMTAPVEETLGGDRPVMAFTLPAEYAMDALPEPNSGSVRLEALEARTVAVSSFSGWATSGRVTREENALRKALASRGIVVTGEASLNQYNPPWTPPFMRRNEVMVPVAFDENSSESRKRQQ